MISIESFIQFATSAHPYIQVALLFAAALFAALVVLPFIAGIVKYFTRQTKTDIDDKLIAALTAPVFYIMLVVAATMSLPLLGFSQGIVAIGQSILHTLTVLIVAQISIRITHVLLIAASNTARLKTVSEQTLPLFNNTSLAIIGAAALYAIFLIWNINVTAWLASAGILGIAIGFAAKDTLSNIISGVFILADKPYSVGDFVVLGSGIMGIVSDVGLRSTRIRTFDDEEVTIPNAAIANEAITNKSTGPHTGRVKVEVGVAYGTNLEKVTELLLTIAREHKLVLDNPEPSVSFVGFGDSSLNFLLSCRVEDPLTVFSTKSDIRYAIDKAFRKHKIEIPFPQQDVHLKNK